MLELINVKKIYTTKAGDTAALDGLSITMPDNGLVFVTGKSGSGKTTLLNVVGALDGFDSGEIIINGKRFSEFKTADYEDYRNTCVGFVFQEYNLLDDYNVEKNIKIANELQGRETTTEEVNEILKIVDLEGLNKRKPNELSGGQKQRVAIARALIKKPQIIMADEPTGALDQTTGVAVMETLKKLSKTNLVMVVSHDLEMAERFADRIIRLVDGKLVEDVLLTDATIKTNVIQTEEEVTVKNGAELDQNETKMLLEAIRERRKINFTDDLTVRQRENTPPIKAVHPEKPQSFVSSKMKLKSSMGLGVNSLKTKPFRLIITILLSVIAFALFGIFDTVGAYNDAKVLANLLMSNDYPSVTVSAQYASNSRASNIRFTQDEIDAINAKTGYNFRGLYEIGDNNGNGIPDYHNVEGEAIPSVTVGKDYYLPLASDFIEFKESEISGTGSAGDTIDRNGYNLKILYGEYPTAFDPSADYTNKKESFKKVAISSYLAEAIVYWHNTGILFYGLGVNINQDIDDIDELIDKQLQISGEFYTIKAIVDCGDVPEKFDELKTSLPNNTTYTLASDLKTYLHSGLYFKLFVGEGFVNAWKTAVDRSPRYVTSTEHAKYSVVLKSGKDYPLANNSTNKPASTTFYKDTDNLENILYFNESHYDNVEGNLVAKPLASNEIVISAENFHDYYAFIKTKIDSNASVTDKQTYNSAYSVFSSRSKTYSLQDRMTRLKTNMMPIINSLYGNTAENPYDLCQEFKIKIKDAYTDSETTKTVKIVGVYFGINTDVSSVGSYISKPIMVSSSLMTALNVYNKQGDFARLVSPINNGYFNAQSLGNTFASQNGIKLAWYENSVLDVIDQNRQSFQDFANLFLYLSLVLALFSIFMLFNYITTSIVARRQSIGVLRALGSNSRDIFRIFFTESIIISVINGILACAVSAVGCIFVNLYIKTVMGFTLSFAVYSLRQIVLTLIASLVTGILASLLPIIKICKEKPVDLIRKS